MIRNSSAPVQWRGGLAPGHERRDGELVVGGVPAGELAAQYGTPLLAIDYDVLDAAVQRARARELLGHDLGRQQQALGLVDDHPRAHAVLFDDDGDWSAREWEERGVGTGHGVGAPY